MLHRDGIYFNQNKLIKRIFRYENSMNDKKNVNKNNNNNEKDFKKKSIVRNKNKLILKIINMSNKLGQKNLKKLDKLKKK